MRNRSAHFIAPAVAALILVALAGCGSKSGSSADLGLKGAASSGSSSSAAAGSGTSSVGGSTNPKATDSGSGSSSGGASDGNATTEDNGGSGSAGGSGTVVKGMTIKILWWNDTVDRAPSSPEVVFGGKSYRPAAGKGDSGSIGPCPIGEELQLIVYPDGRDGAKIVAKFKVDSGMIANSETDAIHVEVKDTGVRVLGNPVDGFIQSFARP